MATLHTKMSDDILAAALSAVTHQTIITFDDYTKKKLKLKEHEYYSELDQVCLHHYNLVSGKVAMDVPVPGTVPGTAGKELLNVVTLTGKTMKIKYESSDTIERVKYKIRNMEGIPEDHQRLVYAGLQLEDNRLVSEYNMPPGATLNLILRLKGGGAPVGFYLPTNLRSPEYDFDFSEIKDDGVTYQRGKFQYKRPCGWNRLALKVLDKYEDNIWLGSQGHRYASDKNEWPVSYHGTAKSNCKSIAEDGYSLNKSQRFEFGHGIYSTPDINIAAKYAAQFQHKGRTYKVVFQNRVNPDNLVEISKTQTGVGQYWISPKDIDVRAYGICIKKF